MTSPGSTDAPGRTDARGRFGSATFGAPPPEPPPAAPEPAAAPRRSTRARVALAALLVAVVVAALLGGLALGGRGQVRVWQLRHDVAAGAAVRVADLRPVEVSAAAARGALRADRSPGDRVARESLAAGRLLPADLLVAGTPLPGAGQVLVGVAAPAGGAPSGLRAGDVVTVFALPATGSGTPAVDVRQAVKVLLVGAEVYAVEPAAGGQVLTLVVPAARAAEVVGLGAQQRLAVALRP